MRQDTTPTGITATRSSRSCRRPAAPPSRSAAARAGWRATSPPAGIESTGLDITWALVSLAVEAGAGPRYLLADGAALPFEPATFDLVVAYNSLMDVDDMPAVVQEMGRVLVPNGRLCICITHPLMDAGRFVAREPDAAFVIERSYLGHRPYEGTFERDGLRVSFKGWCYPLSTYSQALEAGGFVTEALREPEPATHAPSRMDRSRRIPNFLMLRAWKAMAGPARPRRRQTATGRHAPSRPRRT